jgi:spore germination cell wall hydrolase CwlJ-like protein
MKRRNTVLVALVSAAGLSMIGSLAAAAEEADAAVAKGEVLEEAAAAGTPAGETLEPSEAALVDPEGDAPLEDALTCLARTVYWEAKGEPIEAMEAVANVVMNRLASEEFPDTVCDVVTQGRDEGPCQFSWWCDGNPLDAEEADRYEITLDVARRALNQELADRTDGALFFHGVGVSPDWAAVHVETVTLGEHVFYRLGDADD